MLAIAYPQRAAIVSSNALQTHPECSDESAGTLAAELLRERKSKEQPAPVQRQQSAKAIGKRKAPPSRSSRAETVHQLAS